MDLLEARSVIMAFLEERMMPGQAGSIFCGSLPPGVSEGITFSFTGISTWHPDGAMECQAEITGTFEDESLLITQLNILRDLLRCTGDAGVLSWHLRDTVLLKTIPGPEMDRYSFLLPLTVSFV